MIKNQNNKLFLAIFALNLIVTTVVNASSTVTHGLGAHLRLVQNMQDDSLMQRIGQATKPLPGSFGVVKFKKLQRVKPGAAVVRQKTLKNDMFKPVVGLTQLQALDSPLSITPQELSKICSQPGSPVSVADIDKKVGLQLVCVDNGRQPIYSQMSLPRSTESSVANPVVNSVELPVLSPVERRLADESGKRVDALLALHEFMSK